MRIFLDASVWIAGILSKTGSSANLLKRLSKGDFSVLISSHVIAEVVRNLQKKSTTNKIEVFLDWYSALHPELVKGTKSAVNKTRKIINIKDAIILAAALSGKANLLVTLDRRHFLVDSVRQFAKPMLIITPKEALTILRKKK